VIKGRNRKKAENRNDIKITCILFLQSQNSLFGRIIKNTNICRKDKENCQKPYLKKKNESYIFEHNNL